MSSAPASYRSRSACEIYNIECASIWYLEGQRLEPISAFYRETREYVARVLAFSVIYDWRLDGNAVPVTQRMLGRTVPASARRSFTCPTSPAPTSTP